MLARFDVRYPADVAACLVAVNQYQIAVVHHADLTVVLVRLMHLEAVPRSALLAAPEKSPAALTDLPL